MEIKPIRTKRDYETALEELDQLMESVPGTPEFNRLEILSILIEAYEEENYPIPLPDPISAIEFYMKSRGLTRRELEPFIGSRARVSEILNRKRPLTLNMIRKLEKGLGIPAEILVQQYPLDTDPAEEVESLGSRKPVLPNSLYRRLEKIAKEQKTPVDRLINNLIAEGAEKYQ